MFLIRTAFWLALVVLLLPTDPRAQSDLMAKVSYAALQAVTYCDRNQATCQRSNDAWGVFKTKLEFAGRLAGDVVSQHVFGRAPQPAQGPAPAAVPAPQPARTMLTPGDLSPPWRGPRPGSGA